MLSLVNASICDANQVNYASHIRFAYPRRLDKDVSVSPRFDDKVLL